MRYEKRNASLFFGFVSTQILVFACYGKRVSMFYHEKCKNYTKLPKLYKNIDQDVTIFKKSPKQKKRDNFLDYKAGFKKERFH